MKKEILGIGACLLLFLSAFTLLNAAVKAQGLAEAAIFCTSEETRHCPDIGICKDRIKVCENGKWSEECTGGTGPAPQEICDNGLDDNCNGQVDECVSISGSIGIFLIIGGIILLVFALALSRVFK